MNFQQNYKRADYLDFFKNTLLPEDFEIAEESISPGFKTDRIKQITKIGEVPSLDLPVFEVKHHSENDPRVTLSREAFRILANYGKQQALILFISTKAANFRLSLVTLELRLKGKKVTKNFSNPRRYSFFLGPQCKTHTPQQYLSKRITDFDDLKHRFSIEVVNKEFFTQIALLFTKLTGGTRKIGSKKYDEKGCIKLPGTKDETLNKEFAVRLIGRLIFCWFLKKKTSKAKIPLIPEEILSTDGIANAKKNPVCIGGYYHSILEPLFFEALNTPMDERKKNYKKAIWKLIPFLNGGLFNPHEDDFYKLTATGHSQSINTLKVPDPWLTELLGIFETYNFTIDENTPVDVELSIEPEMLGRIFENLLAEINPETGETARKATGSYYTPRPVVEYMVDESLKQYLLTKTDVSEDKITELLSYSDYDDAKLTEKQIEALIEALHQARIIDPACGSGAFPMGILQKILLMLQKLDPDSKIWLDKMLANIPDPMYRKELKKKRIPKYLHKLGIIRECIFGVDIQPIAVEISKLRCFLSLIVDEIVNDDKENRGIEHLPNLEFKFVCANSLISLPEKTKKEKTKKGTFDQSQLFEATDKIDELKELRDLYLTSYGKEKKKIEEQFRKVQSDMFQYDLNMGGTTSQTAKLSQWNPFLDEASSWFDPDWMFGIKDGFDIVIANPPYGTSIKGEYRKTVLSNLGKVPDYEIFYFFIELAYKLLSPKGIKTYIVPNTILFNVYAANYRRKILDIWDVDEILDCTNFVFFEKATVRNAILRFIKSNQSQQVGYRNTANIKDFPELISHHKLKIKKNFLIANNKNWGLVFKLDQQVLKLISKIKKGKKELIDYFPEISQGLIAYDKYRGQSPEIIESRAYHYMEKSKKGLKPWLWGKDVTRYSVEWNGEEYIDYCDGIANPRESKFFKGNRILIREITNPMIYVGITDKEQYHDPAIIVVLPGKAIGILALLGILNSKLATFFHFNSSPKATKGAFPKILVEDIKTFPVVGFDSNYLKIYNKLGLSVKKMLSRISKVNLTNSNLQTDMNKLDSQIDQMVYKLYDLTPKEIDIVENSEN